MNNETERLAEQCDAASRDDRLADGMLYRYAARHMRALRSKLDDARGLFKGHQRDGCDPCKLMQRCFDAEAELNTIKAQASDSTEYVLAQINRELRAELTTARNALFNESLRCEARIAELEKAIKDAPHHMLCDATNLGSVGLTERAPCDCWKSEALRDD